MAMAKMNLSGLDVQSLMDLRKQVGDALLARRATIQRQLESLEDSVGSVGRGRGARGGRRVSAMRGMKVPPKYRSSSGETWAGRGARPRWLVAALKDGKKLDDFLIDGSARKVRKRRSKK
jgi:DNA-binding protein H-NS